MMMALGRKMTQDEIREKIINRLDGDGNASLDFDEFNRWYSGQICSPSRPSSASPSKRMQMFEP